MLNKVDGVYMQQFIDDKLYLTIVKNPAMYPVSKTRLLGSYSPGIV